MGAFLALLIIVLIGVAYSSLKTKANRAFNRKVLYKKTYDEEVSITGTAIVFTTKAPLDAIKYQLAQYVIAEDAAPAVLGKLYIKGKSDNKIVYAAGNRLDDVFTASLRFSESGGETTARLDFLEWRELGGVSNAVTAMRDLVDSVKKAFIAADPNVRITEIKK